MYPFSFKHLSTFAIYTSTSGCCSVTFLIPSGTAKMLSIFMFFAPLFFNAWMAAHAEPPVASIGSSTITIFSSIFSGSLHIYSTGSKVFSFLAIPICPTFTAGKRAVTPFTIPSPALNIGTITMLFSLITICSTVSSGVLTIMLFVGASFNTSKVSSIAISSITSLNCLLFVVSSLKIAILWSIKMWFIKCTLSIIYCYLIFLPHWYWL